MPRYTYVCDSCPEHKEKIVREVSMSIAYFSSQDNWQICDKCGKEMRHVISMPSVVYKGKGFHTTDYPKPVPTNEVSGLEKEYEQMYVDKAISSGEYDEAREATETVVINKWRNTKTGKAVHVPVEVPPIKD